MELNRDKKKPVFDIPGVPSSQSGIVAASNLTGRLGERPFQPSTPAPRRDSPHPPLLQSSAAPDAKMSPLIAASNLTGRIGNPVVEDRSSKVFPNPYGSTKGAPSTPSSATSTAGVQDDYNWMGDILTIGNSKAPVADTKKEVPATEDQSPTRTGGTRTPAAPALQTGGQGLVAPQLASGLRQNTADSREFLGDYDARTAKYSNNPIAVAAFQGESERGLERQFGDFGKDSGIVSALTPTGKSGNGLRLNEDPTTTAQISERDMASRARTDNPVEILRGRPGQNTQRSYAQLDGATGSYNEYSGEQITGQKNSQQVANLASTVVKDFGSKQSMKAFERMIAADPEAAFQTARIAISLKNTDERVIRKAKSMLEDAGFASPDGVFSNPSSTFTGQAPKPVGRYEDFQTFLQRTRSDPGFADYSDAELRAIHDGLEQEAQR